jgi:hypothetical protein
MEDCRKLNIKDLHALHSSSKIIRLIELKKNEMEGTYVTHGREDCFGGET